MMIYFLKFTNEIKDNEHFAAINKEDVSAFYVDTDKNLAMVILKCGEKLILPTNVVQEELTISGDDYLSDYAKNELFSNAADVILMGDFVAVAGDENATEIPKKKQLLRSF